MYYKEILEIREDNDKVYFCFYPNSNEQKIIGFPKKNSNDLSFSAGKEFDRLQVVQIDDAKLMMSSLMKLAVHTHPIMELCHPNSLKLLE